MVEILSPTPRCCARCLEPDVVSETISNVLRKESRGQNPIFPNKNICLVAVFVLDFDNLNFVFVSCFDIRISYLIPSV